MEDIRFDIPDFYHVSLFYVIVCQLAALRQNGDAYGSPFRSVSPGGTPAMIGATANYSGLGLPQSLIFLKVITNSFCYQVRIIFTGTDIWR